VTKRSQYEYCDLDHYSMCRPVVNKISVVYIIGKIKLFELFQVFDFFSRSIQSLKGSIDAENIHIAMLQLGTIPIDESILSCLPSKYTAIFA